MRTSLKERDGNKVKVEVEVTPEELKEAYDVKLRELTREMKIPGFRPGKAPANMVQQKLGDETILAEAIESAMTRWFVQAMLDLGLEAVDRPEVEMGDEMPTMDKPLIFTAEVTVMPEVELGEYKGLDVPKDTVEVTEDEVAERVERLRNEFAELQPVEGRAVLKGDFVLADFQAELDGEPVNELEAADYLFEVGSGQIFPEVDENVVGMSAGDSKSLPVTLPEEVPSEDLAGKTVEFSLALKEIKEKVLPEVTDDWVKEVAEFETVDEFRADVRSRMEGAKSYAAMQKYHADAVAKAAENVTVELPEVVVQREAAEMLGELRSSVEAQGLTLEGYMAATGMPLEQLVESMMPRASQNVKTKLVLDAVAKAENLEVDDEELEAAMAQMGMANNMEAKEVEKRLRKNGRIEELKGQILRDKAAQIVAENAVEGPPEDKDGAGKGPAAKKASGAAKKAGGGSKKPAAAKPEVKSEEATMPAEPVADEATDDEAE